MSTQRSRNKTNRRPKDKTDWLDKLINEISSSESYEFKYPSL